MFVHNLRYKGFSLRLVFQKLTYYSVQNFEPGKTLYQILFKHLIDKETVSAKGLARKYAAVNPDLRGSTVSKLMTEIETAAKASGNARLRKMRFKRLKRGGANPVFERKSTESRFTGPQIKIINETISRQLKKFPNISNAQLRFACLVELRRHKLAENVVLSGLAISRRKRKLGIPVKPGRPRAR